MPQTVQARRLLHQRSPRQPPCLHSLPVTSTSCVPVPASACAAHCRALPARSGLGGRPPCASGAPRQRLTPDSNCRALRPAGSIVLAPGRARSSPCCAPADAVSPSGALRVPARRSFTPASASTGGPGAAATFHVLRSPCRSHVECAAASRRARPVERPVPLELSHGGLALLRVATKPRPWRFDPSIGGVASHSVLTIPPAGPASTAVLGNLHPRKASGSISSGPALTPGSLGGFRVHCVHGARRQN